MKVSTPTARLSPAAMERSLAVLSEYRSAMEALGVRKARAVATSALRDSENAATFLERAGEVLGVEPEVLAGDEEGELSYRGATAGLGTDDRRGTGAFTIVDVGGGSTEIVTSAGPAGSNLATTSLDVGCVRISERHLRSDPPSLVEMAAARQAVRDLVLDAMMQEPRFRMRARLVGLAGTVSTLAMIDLGLDAYDRDLVHHHELTLSTIERILLSLASLDCATPGPACRGSSPGGWT